MYRNIDKKSITLIELLMVLVVVGILGAFVIPNLARARLNAIDREAKAMLVLIRAAQQARAAEGRNYSTCPDAACMNCPFDTNNPASTCNGKQGLGLDLPIRGDWSYSIHSATGATKFCAEATGGPSGNTFSIRQNQWQAVAVNCP